MSYLDDAFRAFCSVPQRYYFSDVIIDPTNPRSGTVEQSTENSFSAELFRHWRNIMDGGGRDTDYTDLALDFDIGKDVIDKRIITYDVDSIRPDLVLHQSQSFFNPYSQRIYIEVKTNPKPFVKNDVQKLCHAIQQFSFDNAIFISVNSKLADLVSDLKSFCLQEDERLNAYPININWKQIYLFHSFLDKGSRVLFDPISFYQIMQ